MDGRTANSDILGQKHAETTVYCKTMPQTSPLCIEFQTWNDMDVLLLLWWVRGNTRNSFFLAERIMINSYQTNPQFLSTKPLVIA